jgi:cell division protein FtsQ
MPAVSAAVDDSEAGPIPRRSKFAVARAPWWRPANSVGRILLGIGTITVVAALAVAGYTIRRYLIRDPHFRIQGAASIQSTGLTEVNREEVLPVFGSDIGRNIFFVPLAERRKELEAIPWVQQAIVMRFLPDRLSVSIVERTPVARVIEGGHVELADADGVLLTMPPAMMAQHHYSFPVVMGINAKDPLPSRRARMAIYQRFLSELDQNNQHFSTQVSEIDLSDPEDLRATMIEPGSDVLAHFGEGQFLHRLQIYQSHIGEWRQRYPHLKGVDLRYNGEVPLEMDNDGISDATARIPAVGAAASATTKPSAPVLRPANATDATRVTAKPVPAKVTTEKPAITKPATTKPAGNKPVSAGTASKVTSKTTKKSSEAKKKAEKLKAAKAKAARDRAAKPKTQTHPAPAVSTQGQ